MAPLEAPAQTAVPETNTEDIDNYLNFLAGSTGEKEIFTYCLMDKESESVIPGYGVMHGKLFDILRLQPDVPIGSVTFHVCLNRTNLRGRRTDNMVSARVLCCDLDNEIELADLKRLISDYTPGLVVESSPKRYHLYWKIDSTIPLTVWSALQLGLAHLLCGDYALRQVTHTIRVPGVMRMRQGQPVMPRIVYLDPAHEELTGTQVETIFPDILAAQTAAENKIKQQNKLISAAIKKTKKGTKLTPKDASGIGRNSYLYSYLREWIGDLDEMPDREMVWAEALLVNGTAFESPLGEVEVGLVVKKALARSLAAREFKEERNNQRLKELNIVQAMPEPILQNGEYVNGHANGNFAYDATSDRELKALPYTDSGLVRRVIQRFGEKLKNTGRIVYAFDDRVPAWMPQKQMKDVLAGFVNSCVYDLVHEGEFVKLFCTDNEGRISDKTRAQALKRFCSNYTISSTVQRLLSCPDMARITITEFDKNPDWMHWSDGLLDMAVGEFRPAKSTDLLLKCSDTQWKGGTATCERWVKFLHQVFAENEDPAEMVRFMQELFGYTMSGRMNVHKVYIHFGQGSNGKSKVLMALYKLLGSDYSTVMGPSTLSRSKNAVVKELERIGAKMEGKRLVIIDDLDSKTEWNEGLVKVLIGTKITARNLYEEEREIRNQAKFHIGCNTAPDPEAENVGILRRLCIIPYPRQFASSDAAEEEINEMIEAELSGIAAWAVEGYKRLRMRGNMLFPSEVHAQTEAYRREHFHQENLILEAYALPTAEVPGEWVEIESILADLKSPLMGGDKSMNLVWLGRALKVAGFESARIGKDRTTKYRVVKRG